MSKKQKTLTYALDKWNQSAVKETMITLRTSGGTEGDDRTATIVVIYETENADREKILSLGRG